MGRSRKHTEDDDDESEEEEVEKNDQIKNKEEKKKKKKDKKKSKKQKRNEEDDHDESEKEEDNEEEEKVNVELKNDSKNNKEEEEEETEKPKKKKRQRRAKKKKRKRSEDNADSANKEEDNADSTNKEEDKDKKEEDVAPIDKNDIFAGRDVTEMPTPKKRKLTEEQKLGKRRKDLRRTIYVEGLPFTYTAEKVKDFFHKELEVENDIIDIRLPRWQDSGRLRGYGHIVFNTIHVRDKALKYLNKKTMGDRYITIQEAHGPKDGADQTKDKSKITKVRTKPRTQPPNCRTIFIKNLPYDAVENEIQKVFEQYGKVVEQGGVRLARNSKTREFKGFGYVQFQNMEGANAAVESSFKSSIVIGNRTVFVDYDNAGGKMKGSFRDEKGWLWNKKFG